MCNMDTVPAAGCQGVEGITQAMAVESSRSWLGIWLTSSDHTSDHSFWPGLQWSFISHSPLLMASDSPQGPVTHSRFRPGPLALAHSRSCSLSVMVRVMWLVKKKRRKPLTVVKMLAAVDQIKSTRGQILISPHALFAKRDHLNSNELRR